MFFGCLPCCGGCETHLDIWPSRPQIAVDYEVRYTSSGFTTLANNRLTASGAEIIDVTPFFDTGLVSGNSYDNPISGLNDPSGYAFLTNIDAFITPYGNLNLNAFFGSSGTTGTILPGLTLRVHEYACTRLLPQLTTVAGSAVPVSDPQSNGISIYFEAGNSYSSITTTLNSGSTVIQNIPQSPNDPRTGARGVRYAVNETYQSSSGSLDWHFQSSGSYSSLNGLPVNSFRDTNRFSGFSNIMVFDTINVTFDLKITGLTVRQTGEPVSLTQFPDASYSAFAW